MCSVCTCLCTCLCIYIYIYVNIQFLMCVNVCTCVCVHIYIYTYMCVVMLAGCSAARKLRTQPLQCEVVPASTESQRPKLFPRGLSDQNTSGKHKSLTQGLKMGATPPKKNATNTPQKKTKIKINGFAVLLFASLEHLPKADESEAEGR